MQYKVDKDKCMSCGSCVATCPDGFKLGDDGKAEVADTEKSILCEDMDGVCPFGAIEKIITSEE